MNAYVSGAIGESPIGPFSATWENFPDCAGRIIEGPLCFEHYNFDPPEPSRTPSSGWALSFGERAESGIGELRLRGRLGERLDEFRQRLHLIRWDRAGDDRGRPQCRVVQVVGDRP